MADYYHSIVPCFGEEQGAIYTFGDSDLAARRLDLITEIFALTRRAFLAETVSFRPRLALDLDSGIGHTTRLMVDMLQPEKTIGLERSKAFLSAVRAGSHIPSVSFVEHDVTKMPLPSGGNADLIYARFLLAHLSNPERVVVDWATQQQPGDLLLLEEVEWIWTEHPVFDTYIGIVAKMMANRGNELYVELRLNTICEKEGLRRHLSRVAQLRPTTGQAARMFSMNLPNWRDESFVRANYTDGEIGHLATELSKLSVSRTEGEIGWRLRQIAIERA